jgi:hypothetical protein
MKRKKERKHILIHSHQNTSLFGPWASRRCRSIKCFPLLHGSFCFVLGFLIQLRSFSLVLGFLTGLRSHFDIFLVPWSPPYRQEKKKHTHGCMLDHTKIRLIMGEVVGRLGEGILTVIRSLFMEKIGDSEGNKWSVRIVCMCRGELDLLKRGAK